MKILSIKETCIYVKDLDRTRNFYANALGLPLISLVKDRHVFFKAGSSVLLCFIADETRKESELPPHGAQGTMHFAFEVTKADYDAALEQIKEAGIEILHEHQWKNNCAPSIFMILIGILLK